MTQRALAAAGLCALALTAAAVPNRPALAGEFVPPADFSRVPATPNGPAPAVPASPP